MRNLIEKVRHYLDIAIELRTWMKLNPEAKPDKLIMFSRIEEIKRNVNFLKSEVLSKSPHELTYKDILALERAVHRIIEAMLNICRHLVSVYSLGLAESYSEYPRKLARAGKMLEDLAENVARLIGLRNILVHRYLEIDLAKLYESAKVITEKIAKKFIEWTREISTSS